MRRRRNSLFRIVGGMVLFLVLILTVLFFSVKKEPDALAEALDLVPRAEITLARGLTLDTIHENPKTIEYPGNKLTLYLDGEEFVFEDVEIKGRGNYTWTDIKRPYRIKFNRKVDFLGLGKLKKWAFLTYNLDDSLLRGDLGFYIAHILNSEYPLSGEFLDLSINGRDLGLYYVAPTVTIAKDVVDLRDEGGILVEFDNAYYNESEYSCVLGTENYLTVKDVVNEDNVEETLADFCADFENLENAARNEDYQTVTEIADVKSLAEYVLFSEFIGSVDSYLTSFYFYRDGEEDLIHAGPAWDFDAAFGNPRWGMIDHDEVFYAPQTLMTREKDFLQKHSEGVEGYERRWHSTLAYDLLEFPEFQELVKEIYLEHLSGQRDKILEYIKERASYIREAAILNNELWGNGDFDEAVDYLIWWVEQRFEVFDEMYGVKVNASQGEFGI